MISNEVRMLSNRMLSHPEEFTNDDLAFSGLRRIQSNRPWDALMRSIVTNDSDLECMFTPEEIKLLRDTAKEILRPRALANIVKQIVGGEDKESQLDLEFAEDPFVYTRGKAGRRTSLTLAQIKGLYAAGHTPPFMGEIKEEE